MTHDPKIRAGWRVRFLHKLGTRDDYELYKGQLVRKHVAGDSTSIEFERQQEEALEMWKASPHYDGRD